MKAFYLTQYGKADNSFKLRELQLPDLKPDEVLIEVEAFGLNYADVMARKGMYAAAPKPPSIIGYEVVGKIIETCGSNPEPLKNKRVVAFTRFGGYATHVIVKYSQAIVINDIIDAAAATALATQYATAFYAVHLCSNIMPGDVVLQHAAAGGVGIAIQQFLKPLGAVSIGISSNDEKLELLQQLGFQHVINRKTQNYEEAVRHITPKGIQYSFNSVAGTTFKKDMGLLRAGGRLILYGAAERSAGGKSAIHTLKLLWEMGIMLPIQLLANSKGIIGINMLSIADNNPEILAYCMQEVFKFYETGIIQPIATSYHYNEMSEAHDLLESGKSVGKIAVTW